MNSHKKNRSFVSTTITLRSIIDELYEFELATLGACPSRYISWCSLPASYGKKALPVSFSQDEILLLVQGEEILNNTLHNFQKNPILYITQDNKLPEIIEKNDYSQRLCIIQRKDKQKTNSLAEVLTTIQLYLLRTKEWLFSLNSIIEKGGEMQDLLDASEDIFENFMDVSDSTYKLIAYTKHHAPIGPLSESLVRIGKHQQKVLDTAASRKLFKQWDSQHGVRVFQPDEDVPDPFVTKVLKNGNAYGGHLVLICHSRPLSPGLIDLFKGLANACQQLLNKQAWRTDSKSMFLLSLLNNPQLTSNEFAKYSEFLTTQKPFSYQLITFDNKESKYIAQSHLLNKMLANIFDENIITTSYNGNLISLITEKSKHIYFESKYWLAVDDFCQQTGFTAYVSNSFTDLNDSHLAYEQSLLARKYKPLLSKTLDNNPANSAKRIIQFEDVLSFFCLDPQKNWDLYSFSMKHSVLDQMIDDYDESLDVNDIKLLYHYLVTERRVLETASILHMHRNTLVKRLEKLSKKYHLNLDDYEVRSQLLTLYHLKLINLAEFKKYLVNE